MKYKEGETVYYKDGDKLRPRLITKVREEWYDVLYLDLNYKTTSMKEFVDKYYISFNEYYETIKDIKTGS